MNHSTPKIPSSRKEIIIHILKDLEDLRSSSSFHNTYALEENIAFFEAIRSIRTYIVWLIKRAPKLEREKLLELTDFPFPRWDREMHRKLVEMEKKISRDSLRHLLIELQNSF